MNIDAKLTISRPSYSDGRELIVIKVEDEKSRIHFLEIEIGLSEFTKAITGQGYFECKGEVRVFKKAKELLPEGWMLDEYLGSKNSFVQYKDDLFQVNMTIFRHVDDYEFGLKESE